jgi:four helix bundle protein
LAESEPRGFKDLVAWQKADDLASLVYRACKNLPPHHEWLLSQVVRCAISVPANIAEGRGRGARNDYARFLDIARGSLAELEYYVHFMKREDLLPEARLAEIDAKQRECSRVLFALWRATKAVGKRNWDHTGRIAEERELYGSFDDD